MRYRYFNSETEVVCVSSFAGKSVVGRAKCAPGDNFNLEVGKKLARLRCDLKIAKKRKKSADKKEIAARMAVHAAKEEWEKSVEYYKSASAEINTVSNELNDLISTLKDK